MTQPKPDLHLRPDDDVGPLLLLVGVGGNRSAEYVLPPLNEDDSRTTMLERVGGYWRSGIGQDGRLSKVRDALMAGRRVFMLGFRSKRVVKAVEVLMGGTDSALGSFLHRTADNVAVTYTRVAKQPDVASLPNGPIATVYAPATTAPAGTPYRVRYHVRISKDDQLRGRMLVATKTIGWVNPALYTTDDEAVRALRPEGA